MLNFNDGANEAPSSRRGTTRAGAGARTESRMQLILMHVLAASFIICLLPSIYSFFLGAHVSTIIWLKPHCDAPESMLKAAKRTEGEWEERGERERESSIETVSAGSGAKPTEICHIS